MYGNSDPVKEVQTHDYNITGKDFALPWILTSLNKDVRSYRSQRKAKNYRNSIQAFSALEYFFPAPGLFNFTCNIQKNLEEVYNCSIKKFNQDTEVNFPYRKFTFSTIAPIFNSYNKDEITGFSHGNAMHGVSSFRPNKMSTNCYQEVIYYFTISFKVFKSLGNSEMSSSKTERIEVLMNK